MDTIRRDCIHERVAGPETKEFHVCLSSPFFLNSTGKCGVSQWDFALTVNLCHSRGNTILGNPIIPRATEKPTQCLHTKVEVIFTI
jgi:hypothetical protein